MAHKRPPARLSGRGMAMAMVAATAPLCAAHAQAGACQGGDAEVMQLIALVQKAPASGSALEHPTGPTESDAGREMRLMIRDHVAKYAPPESLQVTAVREYCRQYSAQEIKALYAFYTSPLGQKLLKVQRDVADSLAARANTLMSAHREELRLKTEALITSRVGNPPAPPE